MPSRVLLAISIVAALLVSAAPAVAAPAADASPPQLRSIELSQTAVTVSRLQTVLVDVRVRLTDDTGVEAVGGGTGYWPVLSFANAPTGNATLARSGGTPGLARTGAGDI